MGFGQESSIARLEDGSALRTKRTTQAPFIDDRRITVDRIPPGDVIVLLLFKPTTQVHTLGFKSLPVDEAI